MRQHILIGRRSAAAPHMWARLTHNGAGWDSSDLVLDRGAHGASSVQHNLHALVAGAIDDVGRGADLTITSRCVNDLIAASPGSIDMPLGASGLVLLPMLEGDGGETEVWVSALVNPSARQPVRILLDHDQRFVRKRLDVVLKSLLTKADLDERCQLHCRRELWVRRSVSAEFLAPDQVIKPRTVAALDPVIAEAEAQLAARQTKAVASAKTKRASQSSDAAMKHNKAAAAKYGKQEAARRAKAK